MRRPQWLAAVGALALSCLIGSCGDEAFDVIVELRTDLVPEVEFARVRTELLTDIGLGTDATARVNEVDVMEGVDYSAGFRVAEFSGVPAGIYVIRVQMTLGTGIVAERAVRVDLRASTAIVITMTRTCRGVVCPRSGDPVDAVSCVGGLCQTPECVTGREDVCAARECLSGADCPPPAAACASPSCLDGLCFNTLDDASCDGGQRCHPDLGCVDTSTCVPLGELCNGIDDDCDGAVDEGFDLSMDLDNCGTCGNACLAVNGAASCVGGACGITCSIGFADCNGSETDGCEVDLSTSTNCGACGAECAAPTPLCETLGGGAFECASECSPGTTLCGLSCVDLDSSVDNCGSCGNACSVSNGTAACVDGACEIGSCGSRFADCSGSTSDGCETNIRTLIKCGSCGVSCSRTNASATCSTGSCRIQTCNSGWGDCSGGDSNGCETQLSSLANCGGCGMSCALANAGQTCSSGSCRITTCNSGWGDCDGVDSNGCETQLSSLTNCGGCGTSCSRNNASETCAGGSCMIASCNAPNWGNCNGTDGDGCEADLRRNGTCGSCSTICSLPETCGGGGASRMCGCASATSCSGPQNCGTQADGCGGNVSCGNCTSPDVCVAGTTCCTPATCGSICSTTIPDGCGGTVDCGSCGGSPWIICCSNACTDRNTDNNNCGGCGIVCTGSETCSGGGFPGICG